MTLFARRARRPASNDRFAPGLALLLWLLASCGQPDVGPGGVAVTLALPVGEVQAVSSIDVSFDQPMVDIGATTTPPAGTPIDIRPRVPGRFRWIGTRTVSFVPDRPLAPATEYTCTIPAGLRSTNGKSLARSHTWTFRTPEPSVVRLVPEDIERPVGPGVRIVAEFNQAVEPAVARRYARLAGVDGTQIDLDARRPGPGEEELVAYWPPGLAERRVVFVPRTPLPLARDWRFELAAGLTGRDGALPMRGGFDRTFRTYGPFVIHGVRVSPDDSDAIILATANEVDTDSLIAHLDITPPVRVRAAWQTWDGTEVRVYGSFKPGASYRIGFRPGARDVYGQPLESAGPFTLTMPDARPQVAVAPIDAVLELGQKREVAVLLTNVSRARLEIAALSPADIGGFLRGEAWSRWGVAADGPGRLVRTLERRTAWNEPDTVLIATDAVLGNGRGGVLAVKVTSLDAPAVSPGTTPKRGGPLDEDGVPEASPPPTARTLVRVTDLGLLAKTSGENALGWVTSLASADPVPGVTLEVRAATGRLLWSATTDADGVGRGEGLPEPSGVDRPHYLVARTAVDASYLELGTDWALESWNFGIPSGRARTGGDIDGMIYGDRDLYRPGDTVHLKTLVRRWRLDGLDTPAGLPVRVEISDPRGQLALEREAVLGPFGSLSTSFPLAPAARPGTWSVRLSAPGPPESRDWTLYGAFTVAEYRAPEFAVTVTSKRASYLAGQALDAVVAAEYHFGAPLRGVPARWSLWRSPYRFESAAYPEYRFHDPEARPTVDGAAGRGEVTLDEDGRARLLPVLDLGDIPVSMNYTLEAHVIDATGQGFTGALNVPVHRGLAYPGLRVAEPLVAAGDTARASVVLVAPDGMPAAEASGQVRLYRREWRTVRRLLVGGVVGSSVTTVDTLIDRRNLPRGAGPHDVEFAVPTAGFYRIVAEATDGTKNIQASAVEFYAHGKGDYAWGWEPGVRLDLVADRARYRPGDTARVLVRAPFPGARALVTVEREGLRSVSTRRLSGTSEVLDIPIPETGAAPNVYVSVALVLGSGARAGADARLVRPEFRLGLLALPVDHGDRRLAVHLAPGRAVAGPGDSLDIDLRLTDADGRPVVGEVSVAVVDEAVLRLFGTETPDPLAFFYRPRPLSVTTSELRRSVTRALSEAKRKGDEAGGGGGEDGAYRSDFATTAHWAPAVVTDAGGRARVGVRLPDNLTTFRVMAVAADRVDRFGSADTTFLVTKPLLVQPATPRFATVGDRFRVGAVVHNRTDAPLTVDVIAEFAGLAATGASTVSALTVGPGLERRVDFEAEARAAGTAQVRLAARGGESDGVALSFPIVAPVVERFDAASGRVEARAEERLFVPAHALPDSGRVTVTLSPTLIAGLEPAFDEMARYPYNCLEQVASVEWSKLLAAELSGTESPVAAAERLVARLAPYQGDDQGFGLWPGDGRSDPALTAWALLALAEAERAGAEVSLLAGPAVQYLGWQLDAAGSDTAAVSRRASTLALALWAIGEHDAPAHVAARSTGLLEFLSATRARLSQTARLYLAHAWARTPGGADWHRRLMAEFLNSVEQVGEEAGLAPGAGLEGWDLWWDSPARRNALWLSASLDGAERSPLEVKFARTLLAARRNGTWATTQANILALHALLRYRDRYEGDDPDVTARVDLAGESAGPVRFTRRDAPPWAHDWPAPAPGQAAALAVTREGRGSLYYTAALRYRESTLDRPAEESALTLARSWELFEGGGGTTVSAPSGVGDWFRSLFSGGTASDIAAAPALASGDLVLVRLTLVVPEAVDQLVIADPLPAGLEPVDLSFAGSGASLARQLAGAPPGVAWDPATNALLEPDFVEMRDREVRAFFNHVGPGVREYRYLARAVTPGTFGAPRARAELLYQPQVSAFTEGRTLTIRP